MWATAGAVVVTPAGTSKTDGARGEEDADGATRWGFWILHVGSSSIHVVQFRSLSFYGDRVFDTLLMAWVV